MICVLRAQNEEGKETSGKALNRKVREGSAEVAKKRNLGVKIFHFPLSEASSLPGTHGQNYMHG
ncbi:MAG: hypothetical protein DMG83_22615 [Acidobacteria bacterium]|nr:MAG: hypothetical protein DMG83_22615 [Acidobacteriota bacterium]